MVIIGKVCDKGKKADEENPERSNVTLKLRYEGEVCNCNKCVLIAKESCIGWIQDSLKDYVQVGPLRLLIFWVGYFNALLILRMLNLTYAIYLYAHKILFFFRFLFFNFFLKKISS